MASSTIASRLYTTGSYPVGPFPVALGETKLTVSLTRESWPNPAGEVVHMDVEYSPDGSSWQFHGGFGAHGGDYVMPNHTIATVSRFAIDLPSPGLSTRQIRGTVQVAADLRTAITLDRV